MTKIFSNNFLALSFLNSNTLIKSLKRFKERKTVILDIRCDNYKTMWDQNINNEHNRQFFNESFNWIILENNSQKTIASSKLYLAVNSKVFLVTIEEQTYKIDAVFKYSNREFKSYKNDVGVWTVIQGFLYFNRFNIAVNRSNLNHLDLNIIFPYRYSPTIAKSFDIRQVMHKQILTSTIFFQTVSEILNATYSPFYFAQETTTSLFSKDDPMFINLKSGVGDIIGLPMRLVKERMGDFRYLALSSKYNIAFIFKAPALAYIKNVYCMPFHKTSWYSLLGVLTITTLVLYLLSLVYKVLLTDNEIHLSLSDVIMIQVSALFQKSSNWELRSWSGRVATGFLYVTLMIVPAAYTASIVVYLQATAEDITDFKGLINSRIEVGTQNISSIVYESLMRESNDAMDMSALQTNMVNTNTINLTMTSSITEGIKKVRNQLFAFYTFLEPAYDVIESTFDEYEKCSLRTFESSYSENDKYLLVAQNSTLADHYKIGFRKIKENGIYQRETLKHFRRKPKCENSGTSNFSGTGIIETQVVFLLFIVCVLLSLVIFVIERLVYSYRNSITYYKHYNQWNKYVGGLTIQPYAE